MANPTSPAGILHAQPHAFTFDAAVRLMRATAMHVAGTRTLTFEAHATLAAPLQEILSVTLPTPTSTAQLRTTVLGLTGPTGDMPRWYTELLNQVERQKSRALKDFLTLISQPALSAFADAGTKYRLHASAEQALWAKKDEPIGAAILAFAGYDSTTARQLPLPADIVRHYAGFFASYPRSASKLGAMLSDFLGRPVVIEEFVGAWLAIPADQRTRLPKGRQAGAFCALGVDAALGLRTWDQQGRFILRIGPLCRQDFEKLLPGKPGLIALFHLTRAYVGAEMDFAIRPELKANDIPAFRLAGGQNTHTPPQLGWTTWLPSTSDSLRGRKNVADALFGAWLVTTT